MNNDALTAPNPRWYPWDENPDGTDRFVGLGTVQPMYSCPADGRTLQTSQVTQFGTPFTIAFTAYQGVNGICHRGAEGAWSDNTWGGNKIHNDEVDPFTGRLTGMNGILITTVNALGQCPPGVRIGDVTDGTSNTLMVGERPPS